MVVRGRLEQIEKSISSIVLFMDWLSCWLTYWLTPFLLVTPITGNEEAVRNNAAQLQDQLTKYLAREKTAVDERIKYAQKFFF